MTISFITSIYQQEKKAAVAVVASMLAESGKNINKKESEALFRGFPSFISASDYSHTLRLYLFRIYNVIKVL